MASRGDYYALLGVRRDASTEEVRRAYEIELNRAHKAGAVKHMEDLLRAFETLSDPRRREVYDRFGFDPVRERSPGAAPLPAPWRTVKAGGFAPTGATKQGPRRWVIALGVGIAGTVAVAGVAAAHPRTSDSRESGPSVVVPSHGGKHPHKRVKVVCQPTSGGPGYVLRARPGSVVSCKNGAIPSFD